MDTVEKSPQKTAQESQNPESGSTTDMTNNRARDFRTRPSRAWGSECRRRGPGPPGLGVLSAGG